MIKKKGFMLFLSSAALAPALLLASAVSPGNVQEKGQAIQEMVANDKKALERVVQEELKALREGNILQGYHSFSSDVFKKKISLEQFRLFLKEYPIFTSYEKVVFKESVIDRGLGKAEAELIDQSGSTLVEYTLGIEEGAWKIWAIQVLEVPEGKAKASDESELEFSSAWLVQTIRNQLKDASGGGINKAYDDYTSKSFKEATPLKSFEAFVENHSVIGKNQGAYFGKPTFNGNIASIKAVLLGEGDEKRAVEYDFIKEDNRWKILHIKVYPPGEGEAVSGIEELDKAPLEIVKTSMGTEIDDKGIVQNPASTFGTDLSRLYIHVALKNGIEGTEIKLSLKNIDTKTTFKPDLTTTLQTSGDAAVTFVLEAPEKGWEKGRYLISLTSSTGAQSTVPFKVE